MARHLREHSNLRCHWDNKMIASEKPAYQVQGVKASGIYHGKQCYESALKHYEQVENESLE